MNTNSTPATPVEAMLYDHLKDAFKNPKDDPALPRVLIIGDSISIGYTIPVRQILQGKANVHRPPENCQHSAYGLQRLTDWLGTGRWDVIHCNWCIWDTHAVDKASGRLIDEATADPATTKIRHTHAEYRDHLRQLITRLKATGAKLIWATGTPICCRSGARFEDVANYNSVAVPVMQEEGIPVNDLYSFTLPHTAEWMSGDKCHFNEVGNRKMGEKVSGLILEALKHKT